MTHPNCPGCRESEVGVCWEHYRKGDPKPKRSPKGTTLLDAVIRGAIEGLGRR
jgi:hypothetical protein